MARKRVQRTFVYPYTEQGVSLGDAAGDVVVDSCVPADSVTVVDVSYTIETAGIGAAANHLLNLQAGTAGAGFDIAAQAVLDADGAVGLTVVAVGLPNTETSFPLSGGVALQIANAESAAISTGAIINLVIFWNL